MMDSLLPQPEKSSLGTSVNNFYTGGFLHADDIRTHAAQVALVQKFANDSFLKLNMGKCEATVFSTDQSAISAQYSVDGELAVADLGGIQGCERTPFEPFINYLYYYSC